MLSNLVDTSKKLYRGLKIKEFIARKEFKYFAYGNRRLVILERCNYYLKSTRGFRMSLGDQLFQTVFF